MAGSPFAPDDDMPASSEQLGPPGGAAPGLPPEHHQDLWRMARAATGGDGTSADSYGSRRGVPFHPGDADFAAAGRADRAKQARAREEFATHHAGTPEFHQAAIGSIDDKTGNVNNQILKRTLRRSAPDGFTHTDGAGQTHKIKINDHLVGKLVQKWRSHS